MRKHLLAASLLLAFSSRADVKLPAILSDNMCFQAKHAVPIWGKADAGEQVTVAFADQKQAATADKEGRWSVTLTAMPDNAEPRTMTVTGKNTLTVKNILVGQVWVASGQSNMEFPFAQAHNAATEAPKANHPKIRIFNLKRTTAWKPLDDCEGHWEECTPQTTPHTSAVGYFFVRDLQEKLGVPMGLIHTSWGGTPAQAWTSLEALKAVPSLKPYVDQVKPTVAAPGPNVATSLYNGMIAPILNYAIEGTIWYQGESNAGNPKEYQTLFPAMIEDWRTRWTQTNTDEKNFPFFFVQLANFQAREKDPVQTPGGWPGLREAQHMTLKLPNTGEAVIIDIGQANDIHPKDKMDVGHRLALAAMKVAYGMNDVVFSGPTYKEMKVEGSKIHITFDNVGGGLEIAAAPATQPGVALREADSELKGFSIAGPDHHFVWAKAKITGSDTIEVWADGIDQPSDVRYAWANNPECNLYNKEHLPASPFRTDKQ